MIIITTNSTMTSFQKDIITISNKTAPANWKLPEYDSRVICLNNGQVFKNKRQAEKELSIKINSICSDKKIKGFQFMYYAEYIT